MKSKKVQLRPLNATQIIKQADNKSAKIYERNPHSGTEYDYKPVGKTLYDTSIYKANWEKINSNKPWRKEETAEFRKTNDVALFSRSQYNAPSQNEIDHYEPCHVENFLVYKHKKYNELVDQQTNVPASKLVSQREYLRKKISQDSIRSLPPAERGEEADKRNVYRKNLYVSKPLDDINKDFKHQELIRNAATSSEDTPYWFQGPLKYYTQDFFESVKQYKASLKALPKTDIFDQKLNHYSKLEDPFSVRPPAHGQVYDTHKMALVEKPRPEDTFSKFGNVKLRWEEDSTKQKYDQGLCQKIGSSSAPFIKTLREKEIFNANPLPYKKIGEDPVADRLKKAKDMDLKIGHPHDEYKYTKKGREDGFLANRKVIEGENYTRSNFFC
jgi:hypothetical protein